MIPAALMDRLRSLAGTSRLLVACDYDGTLAEIVLTPAFAFPHSAALRALHALGEISSTATAIVSGRSLSSLSGLLGADTPHFLAGSHGAEWERPGVTLTVEQRDRLAQVADIIESIADQGNGMACELKPAGVALHVRSAEPVDAASALAVARERCAALPGVTVLLGNRVVEFMVVETGNAAAVDRARRSAGATGVLFVGDEQGNQDVFRSLSAVDVGVPIATVGCDSSLGIRGAPAVAAVLDAMGSLRRDWVGRHGAPEGARG